MHLSGQYILVLGTNLIFNHLLQSSMLYMCIAEKRDRIKRIPVGTEYDKF